MCIRDRLDLDARSRQSSCAELRVVLPHATYASYATVDFLQQMADSQQLRVHIQMCIRDSPDAGAGPGG